MNQVSQIERVWNWTGGSSESGTRQVDRVSLELDRWIERKVSLELDGKIERVRN